MWMFQAIKYLIYIGEVASAVISLNSFFCKYILPTYSRIGWLDKIIKYMHKLALNPSKREARIDL
jgi:hypothetical protein